MKFQVTPDCAQDFLLVLPEEMILIGLGKIFGVLGMELRPDGTGDGTQTIVLHARQVLPYKFQTFITILIVPGFGSTVAECCIPNL